jgi:hypothetical protein
MFHAILHLRRGALILGLLTWLTPVSLAATTFYVAPVGKDAWSGRLQEPNAAGTDGPLATLAGARDAVRRLKAQGALREAVDVVVAAGAYPLAKTLVFEPQDSGTADGPIVYRAAEGARPIITGGRIIRGFTPAENGQWKAHLPEVAAGKWYFEDLYVNGRRATRACSPNESLSAPEESFHHIRALAGPVTDPVTGKTGPLPNRAFVAEPKAFAMLAALPKDRLNDALINSYFCFENSISLVAALDAKTGTVIMTGDTPWPFNAGWRYTIENIKAALDAPGEWFLDRSGDLFYIPLPGEDMTKAEVVAPALTELVRLAGDPRGGRYVEHITLRGLRFQHCRCPVPPQGHNNAQAAVGLSSAITADGARQVAIEDAEVAHVGGYAVWFRRGCQACRLQRCLIHDLAGGGVRIGQGWDNDHPAGPDISQRCVVDNNIIRNGGHLDRGAVGIWIGHSPYNQVTHNDVSDFRYTGISVGWRWGYDPSDAHHNKIEFNHVHHLGGMLADMGAIYTLGFASGTTISNNVIHDIYPHPFTSGPGTGVYMDQGTSGIVMENNLIYNVKTAGYNHNFGRANVVRNNIFAFGREAQLSLGSVEPHCSFTFANNILYWNGGQLLNGPWKEANLKMENNLYFDASGAPVKFVDLDLQAWQALGKDHGSLVADPRFVDPARYDFRLQPGSPTEKIGFRPFDSTKAGVYGEASWRKEAAAPVPARFADRPASSH